jgi:type I restriction enzyme R subunit
MAGNPIFKPFNPDGPLRIYIHDLPHWRQPGATYFVTFRLKDSIPKPVLAEWLELRARFFRANRIDPQWRTSDGDRFVSTYSKILPGVRRAFEREQAKMLHEELDKCQGSCVLNRQPLRKIVCDSLSHFDGTRLWLGDYIVMPNHVHALIQPFDQHELEDLLGSIKRWTSRCIRQVLELTSELKGDSFWQHESYDRIVRDREELAAFRRYTARNGIAAKLNSDQYDYRAAPWLDEFAPRQ